jgi:hypothetical protein
MRFASSEAGPRPNSFSINTVGVPLVGLLVLQNRVEIGQHLR